MKKNKILMISSSAKLGGGPLHMFRLSELISSKFNIVYAIPKSNDYSKYLSKENHINISERKLNVRDLIKIYRFSKDNNIDIIHAHGKGAAVIARIIKIFNNKPLIFTFHGIHLKCHSKLVKFFYILYENIFGLIDTFKVFVSKSEKLYAERSNLFIGRNFAIINNGVKNKQLKEDKRSYEEIYYEKYKIIKRDLNIISICRFVPQKNIDEIFSIASKLSNYNFIILGDGELFYKFQLLKERLNIRNIYLIGKVHNIYEHLYSSDLFLSTSLYEGLPLSLIEAMSIGLPIIATNVVGNIDAIEHGKSGYLYDLGDLNKAIDHINDLAVSKSLRKNIGINSYTRQRSKFSEEFMAKNYINLFTKIVNKNEF